MISALLEAVSRVPRPAVVQPHCTTWRALIGSHRPAVKLFGHLAVLPPEDPATKTVAEAASEREAAALVGDRLAQYFHKLRVQHHTVRDVSMLCAWWRIDATDAPAYDDWQEPTFANKSDLATLATSGQAAPSSLDAPGSAVFVVPDTFPKEHRRRLNGDSAVDPLTRALIIFHHERAMADRCWAALAANVKPSTRAAAAASRRARAGDAAGPPFPGTAQPSQRGAAGREVLDGETWSDAGEIRGNAPSAAPRRSRGAHQSSASASSSSGSSSGSGSRRIAAVSAIPAAPVLDGLPFDSDPSLQGAASRRSAALDDIAEFVSVNIEPPRRISEQLVEI